jgi:hypothetical protein
MKDKADNIKIEVSEWERTVDRTEWIKWILLRGFMNVVVDLTTLEK